MTDFREFLRAVWQHAKLQLTGGVIAIVLLLWSHITHKDIPDPPFWGLVILALFWAAFNAWREEHARASVTESDPEVEVRRSLFERELAKLSLIQLIVLQEIIRHGDRDATSLSESLDQQGRGVDNNKADLILTQIAQTGLIEAKNLGMGFHTRYGPRPAFDKLLIEWARPATPTDIRVADKARSLQRLLTASFERTPHGGPKSYDDFTSWATQLLRGFNASEAALRELIDLRPEASLRIGQPARDVEEQYYAAAKIINEVFKDGGVGAENDAQRAAIQARLNKAREHINKCLDAIRAIETLVRN